jgi:threonylcarbamoyladenosine tRNA methylthiotransferase MtaB
MSGAIRVYGHTLGCRLNTYETEALLEEFRRRCGAVRTESPEDADIILVNSCAVTGRSTARSRKSVRQLAASLSDRGTLVVTGCVVQTAPGEFDGQNVILVPNTGKISLVEDVAARLGIPCEAPIRAMGITPTLFPAEAPTTISRTRAFLKVQDGCSNACTYCVVPSARGPSRSQPREVVLEHAGRLAEAGFSEILLTGVDLVRYGNDLYGGAYDLADLVRDLLRLGGFRLRLSSMEPIGLSRELLSRLALPGVCRHIHLPIQSGSDAILGKMGRSYSRLEIERILDRCAALFPGLALGADIIVGFPGESEENFRETVELVSHPAVSYLHVFPFSPRPGTPAAGWNRLFLHPETVTSRAEALRAISRHARRRFRESAVGRDALAIVEGRTFGNTGRRICMTDNYIPLLAPEGAKEGEMVQMMVRREDVCWETR